MARKPLPPGEKKVLFNCYLDREVFARLKTICFRMSIHRGKKFSEGAFVRGKIIGMKMPAKPTQEQIDAYIALYPDKKKEISALAALPTPPPLG